MNKSDEPEQVCNSAEADSRHGFAAEVPTTLEDGLLVFDPGPVGAVTAEHVMQLKDDLEGELE
ncbi:MAG TPA: hypothetical protein VKB38_13690 [Terracidiphilus sp.]|nr:hypothetical protein [Terracidiphilus sp.]